MSNLKFILMLDSQRRLPLNCRHRFFGNSLHKCCHNSETIDPSLFPKTLHVSSIRHKVSDINAKHFRTELIF